jgi:hypothetical protein
MCPLCGARLFLCQARTAPCPGDLYIYALFSETLRTKFCGTAELMMASAQVSSKCDTVVLPLPLHLCSSHALAEKDLGKRGPEGSILMPSGIASSRKPQPLFWTPSKPSLPNKAEPSLLQGNLNKGTTYRKSSGPDRTLEPVTLECVKGPGIHVPMRKCVPEEKEDYHQHRSQIEIAQGPNVVVSPNPTSTERTGANPLHNSKAPLMSTKFEQNYLNRLLDVAMGKESGRNTPIVSKTSDDRTFKTVPDRRHRE